VSDLSPSRLAHEILRHNYLRRNALNDFSIEDIPHIVIVVKITNDFDSKVIAIKAGGEANLARKPVALISALGMKAAIGRIPPFWDCPLLAKPSRVDVGIIVGETGYRRDDGHPVGWPWIAAEKIMFR
jgi:hypothetical protein